MKHNCDIISDLLPLYMDNACSSASAQAVEEHLAECSVCSKMLEDMRKSEIEINTEIIKERNEVLDKQAKFFKRRSVLAGSIIGGIFAIPILVCLIVNLAAGAGLTWFFIVLAAMFVPASLTVVPLMVPENKALCTLGAFTASLLVLLGVCSIYTGGSWFAVAASAVVFGLTVIFSPFVVRAKPIAKILKNNKALTAMAAVTLTYIIMIVSIGITSGDDFFFENAFNYSFVPFAYIWALFAVIRFVKLNKEFKAAICVFMSAVIFFLADTICGLMFGGELLLPGSPFGSDLNASTTEDRFKWVILIIGAIVSAILTVIGLIKQKKENKKKE